MKKCHCHTSLHSMTSLLSTSSALWSSSLPQAAHRHLSYIFFYIPWSRLTTVVSPVSTEAGKKSTYNIKHWYTSVFPQTSKETQHSECLVLSIARRETTFCELHFKISINPTPESYQPVKSEVSTYVVIFPRNNPKSREGIFHVGKKKQKDLKMLQKLPKFLLQMHNTQLPIWD